MTRICILISIVLVMPACNSRCIMPDSADNTLQTSSVDTSYKISQPASAHPQSLTVQKTSQPDYYFAVAQYNKVYYGNSLENLLKLDVESAQLDISPDGRTIAYSSYSRPGYRVIKLVDIENQTITLLDLPPRNAYMGSWNNNGRYIAINSQSTLLSHWQPVIYDIEEGSVTDIAWLDTDNDYYNPVFSPDGKMLVFHDICHIYICAFRDGNVHLKRVIDTEDLCFNDNAGFSDSCKFQISNDGKYLVFTIETDIFEEDICPKITLCSYNIDTGSLRQVTDRNTNVNDFAIDSSGDIYFCTCNKEKQIFEGYMSRIDGTGTVKSATFKEQTYAIAVAN